MDEGARLPLLLLLLLPPLLLVGRTYSYLLLLLHLLLLLRCYCYLVLLPTTTFYNYNSTTTTAASNAIRTWVGHDWAGGKLCRTSRTRLGGCKLCPARVEHESDSTGRLCRRSKISSLCRTRIEHKLVGAKASELLIESESYLPLRNREGSCSSARLARMSRKSVRQPAQNVEPCHRLLVLDTLDSYPCCNGRKTWHHAKQQQCHNALTVLRAMPAPAPNKLG